MMLESVCGASPGTAAGLLGSLLLEFRHELGQFLGPFNRHAIRVAVGMPGARHSYRDPNLAGEPRPIGFGPRSTERPTACRVL